MIVQEVLTKKSLRPPLYNEMVKWAVRVLLSGF
jgi:hypothetical protein